MKGNEGKWKEMEGNGEGYKMKWKDYIYIFCEWFLELDLFLQTKLKQHIVNRD